MIKMKKKALVIFLLLPFVVFTQQSVKGKVTAGDSVQLIISSVTPTDFPVIEVLFRAENLKQYPYWGLEKSDLIVAEKDYSCEVLTLTHFSEKEPINISIVVDHSGSMLGSFTDYLAFYDNDTVKLFEAQMAGTLPEITTPLDYAIEAVKKFLKNFKSGKDRVGLFAFDNTVDIQVKPSYDIKSLPAILDTLKPTGSTAFFDAVYLATEGLTELEGINVVIALTDGTDNSSQKQSSDIITLSREKNIPIYCIGLGDAMSDTLQLLADSTNGYYAYTKKSSALDSIYTVLKKKILAYYLMTYQSENWASLDNNRELTISFNQNDIYTVGNRQKFDLPNNVAAYLKEREEKIRREYQYLVGGVIAGSVLFLGLGVFIIRRKKRKKLTLLKLYPNPGNGNCSVDVQLDSNGTADLIVNDFKGSTVFQQTINQSGNHSIDFSHLPPGSYILYLKIGDIQSNVKRYIKM